MRSGKPDISPSTTEIGATAVRIPICAAFGFGFNNAESTRQRAKLLSQVRRERAAKYSWDDVVGIDGALKGPFEAARRAAATRSPVIVYGESGTGKELFAQAIHNSSPRSDKPFIAINCAALPETLVEATFFGYLEGAFTGARRGGQKGLFEQADGGTLLLDEVSEMSLESQAKLLRTLQEREVTRIGGGTPVAVDVRIICTSNRDLAQCVADGAWRADLFYRLNVVDIHLPPLRAHKEDIPVLVEAIRAKLSDRDGRTLAPVPAAVVESLKGHDWPGNVRELQNVLDRAYNLAGDGPIAVPHLPVSLTASLTARAQAAHPAASAAPDTRLSTLLSATERQLLLDTLKRCNGNRTRAARELGISVTTLWRRLRKIEGAPGQAAQV
jgi:transcriptional regulator with PAS, ATPase and Fis domain